MDRRRWILNRRHKFCRHYKVLHCILRSMSNLHAGYCHVILSVSKTFSTSILITSEENHTCIKHIRPSQQIVHNIKPSVLNCSQLPRRASPPWEMVMTVYNIQLNGQCTIYNIERYAMHTLECMTCF